MFAIIKTGGKQYRVSEGDEIAVEKITPRKGNKIEFKEVLLVSAGKKVHVGRPLVKGAAVLGELAGEKKAKKLHPLKKKRRKGYTRRTGHRQSLSVVKISKIQIN